MSRTGDGHAGKSASREQGMVTAEMAVALPALVLVLGLLLGAVSAGLAQVRCVDAARDGARELARDEPAAHVVRVVALVAPGAHVAVRTADGLATVVVTERVRLFGLTGIDVTGRASTTMESP